MSFIIGNEVYL